MNPQTSQRALYDAASQGLRALAADDRCRKAFTAPGSLLQHLLSPSARRYVVAADREEFLACLAALRAKGYRSTVEFVGEENSDRAQIERVVQEYLSLLAYEPAPEQVGFDLSNVGLAVSRDLALRNTARIVEAAADRGCEVILSMERFPTVDEVLGVYRELAAEYDTVGITLQAHLHRTEHDLAAVAQPGRKVRLVKGAFQEPPDVAVGRGPALDERYLRFAGELVERGVRLSLATQDPAVLAAAESSGLLARVTEIEMLHGVQPQLLRRYQDAGHTCRIYATYGENWWLHLLHRLAEHPPMVLTALADLADGTERVVGADY
ncbi:proline dehydrogenase family protein [Streptomyces sp. NPDC058246]|uniref:proline dehydrogenase family protein n=1 Tax=Streptomyces sp. NPDC058246 TaxID=3346400 RepID=UPI0036F0B3D7